MGHQGIVKWLAVAGVAVLAASCVKQQLSQKQLAAQAYFKNDYDAAFQYMQPLLAANDPVTLMRLGYMYRHGLGVEKNYETSLNYSCRAALAGEEASFTGIGFMLSQGYGVPIDGQAASVWYLWGAKLGSPGAQLNLGRRYLTGRDIPKDLVQAHMWMTLAHNQSRNIDHDALRFINQAEEEMTEAQIQDSLRRVKTWTPEPFADGLKGMVRTSPVCARRLSGNPTWAKPYARFFQQVIKSYKADQFDVSVSDLSPVAEKGDQRAQFMLAHMYHQGYGVAQNQRVAVQWYCRAAGRGQPDAMYWIGKMYEDGDGLPGRKDLAKAWYERSAQLGNPFAQLKLGQGYLRGGLVEKDPGQAYLWLYMASNTSFNRRGVALELLDEARALMPQKQKIAAIHEAADWEPSEFDDQMAAQIGSSSVCSQTLKTEEQPS